MALTANKLDRLAHPDRFLSSLARRLLKPKRQPGPTRGLPEGMAFETLNELCLEHLAEPLQRASYVHLSGWKRSGAFRLFLESKSGRVWRLIYKNALYDQEQIPALIGLPIRPGPPEYLVYKHSPKGLARYLPTVYLCSEVLPGRHYRYVLEDLGQEYQRLSDYYGTAAWKGNLLSTAAELPDLHRAMSEWSMDIDPPSYLLQFDRAFSSALTVYAKNNLEHYVRSTGDGMVAKLVESWPRIAEAHESVGSYGTRVVGLIHGDYHPANIYVHRKEIGRLKLVDWEWTGWGKPHADLAALLKRQPPETEEAALLKYSRQDRRLSAREHRKLYEWCQLERGLLDAAFLARQQMGSARKLNWITDFIRKSALRALRAQEQLSLLI